MDILPELLNSHTRAKILKLLFRNPKNHFRVGNLSKKIQIDYYAARRELLKLKSISIVSNNKEQEFFINPNFEFYDELRALVLRSSPISKEKILKDLKKIGGLKLALLTGVFLGEENSRVDLLIVGAGFKKEKLSKFLKDLEAEVGKEINYVVMEPDEFQYRKKMFDKFILGLLEGPKEILLNRLTFG